MRKVLSGVLVWALAGLGLELGHHTHHAGEAAPSTSVERGCPRLPGVPHLHPSALHHAERCPACAVGPVPSMEQAEACEAQNDAPHSVVALRDLGVREDHRHDPPAARGPPSSPAV
ncbi:MAG: hypothetical protein AB2L07_15370 [Thermoanaerobaculaceae bacterium]